MTLFVDEGRGARRRELRETLALVGALGTTAVALLLLPVLATAAFVWLWPAHAATSGGWVTIGAVIVAALGFPLSHAAAHAVLVGAPAPWLQSRGRFLRLLAFGLWTGVPLAWVLHDPLHVDAGILSLVWGGGLLLYPLLRNAMQRTPQG